MTVVRERLQTFAKNQIMSITADHLQGNVGCLHASII